MWTVDHFSSTLQLINIFASRVSINIVPCRFGGTSHPVSRGRNDDLGWKTVNNQVFPTPFPTVYCTSASFCSFNWKVYLLALLFDACQVSGSMLIVSTLFAEVLILTHQWLSAEKAISFWRQSLCQPNTSCSTWGHLTFSLYRKRTCCFE